MKTIQSYSGTRFKLNGFPYAKVYQLRKGITKNTVSLVNVNDSSDKLFRNVPIQKINVNGRVYNKLSCLSDALECVLFQFGNNDKPIIYQTDCDSSSGNGGIGLNLI